MRKTTQARQQSAMEYLMTYGWSILIIAIVLAALFSLGVFSNSNLGPRAQPNSCRVYRPNGIGTTTNINLEGVCNGEIPEYVAQVTSSSHVLVSNVIGVPQLTSAGTTGLTMVVWATTPTANVYQIALQYASGVGGTSLGVDVNCGADDFYITVSGLGADCITPIVPSNAFIFYALSYNGVTETGYEGVGGQLYSGTWAVSLGGNVVPASQLLYIDPNSWQGEMANAQVYDTVLDANALQALYLEGIGGAPVEPQNLAGWWPLDGDSNDYSGNGNNGPQTNWAFTSTWTSLYTKP